MSLSGSCAEQHRHKQGGSGLVGTSTAIWHSRGAPCWAPVLARGKRLRRGPLSTFLLGVHVKRSRFWVEPPPPKKKQLYPNQFRSRWCTVTNGCVTSVTAELMPALDFQTVSSGPWSEERLFSATQARAELCCSRCDGSHWRRVCGWRRSAVIPLVWSLTAWTISLANQIPFWEI